MQSPLKTTREWALMREKEYPPQPFTNFYPVGGGGKVIANPHLKEIPVENLPYSTAEKNILA